jgi:glycerol-3-phosphate acyltransferase PlsX
MLIAVDADGGDYAPREIVRGAADAAEEYHVDIALLGKKTILDMLVRKYSRSKRLSIIETTQTIDYKESPVHAVRNKPDASIPAGTRMVKEGAAAAFVSAGNTGAVLTAAYLTLSRIEGVQRPALCGIIMSSPLTPSAYRCRS